MIRINNKDISNIHLGTRGVLSVYLGTKLVWRKQAEVIETLSCFSNGYWIDDYPWADNTPWTD